MSTKRVSPVQHLAFWVGWIVFGLVLAALLNSSAGMPVSNAVIFGLLLSGIAQLNAWSAVFSCRTAPLETTPAWRLLATHLTAAVLLTFFWVQIGAIVAHQLTTLPSWQDTYTQYSYRAGLLYGAGIFYYVLCVAVNYALIAQRQTKQAQERVLESTMRAREAELAALKAQINPHFLYNSLNSISALTSIDPARARDMCVSLADFLRLTLGMSEKAVIPLREELTLLEKYCAIERVRDRKSVV